MVEPWETRTGLPERAVENRFSVVPASRRTPAGASIIATAGEDFTLWTVWKNRPFDGSINYPILTKAVAARRSCSCLQRHHRQRAITPKGW